MTIMALEKCPRCELNYMLDGGELCTVCRREVKGEHESIDMTELCSACGEHPAVSGVWVDQISFEPIGDAIREKANGAGAGKTKEETK